MMIEEGIYLIEYQGAIGAGASVLVFRGGKIVGADVTGSIWRGDYQVNDGSIAVNLALHVKEGVQLVQGPVIKGEPFQLHVSLDVTPDQLGGPQFPVDTPVGPVLARLRLIERLAP
jgi:hypothetical protein